MGDAGGSSRALDHGHCVCCFPSVQSMSMGRNGSPWWLSYAIPMGSSKKP